MRIAVIGRGNIGGTLGRGFSQAGHDVVYGVRGQVQASAEATIAEAVRGADVVLLAVPGDAVDDVLASTADGLTGRLVIDATNKIGESVVNAAAQIREAAPGVRYARAFNTLGRENFADPVFDGASADLFYSSEPDDQPVLEELIKAIGLRPVYAGAGKEAEVDGLLGLWRSLVQARGGNRHLAFRLLERS
ncbi:NAD(P)-binding domain-containing protein [Streptomyces sp. GXMU-J15]|uniref:NAD(P)-binding domain-containing protein n=1 Tax=Streptomyces fuscus TaxID=3048495 RepID=A0ABT7J026_9ACTN|nr:NAD(P)-binding domain-containing protein [Streptomyces fuscus]MDL2078190.1 NAD(P)-binding domain-containing protein [Streptomyces fuscus]